MAIQVKEATRDGQGNSLPVLGRQFISFSYGGKNIEDFDLLVVFANDRLEKNIYADFNDITSSQDEIDGQYYWGSSYNAGTLTFSLATDGITSKQLEDFTKWFVPGVERELILTEKHNRGILARVSSAPVMSLLPFEESYTIKVAGKDETFRSTLYKGDITISFVMDDPYWYSLKSILTGDLEEEDKKLIFEDGVPHTSMLKSNCILAGKNYFSTQDGVKGVGAGIALDGNNQEDAYLYYCGTADAKPIISFNTNISYNGSEVCFEKSGSSNYYYLRIGNSELDFSLPEIMGAYNMAVNTVLNFQGTSILDLRAELRDGLYEYYVRAWAIGIIDAARNDADRAYVSAEGEIKSTFKDFFVSEMKKFFQNNTGFTFTINSKTGEVVVSGIVGDNVSISEKCGNMIKSRYIKISERTCCDEEGFIYSTNCLQVSTNITMTGLIIDYKYMYL